MKKRADDLTAAAGRKSSEADNYRDKWEKMKEQVSVAKSAEREHWERAKKVSNVQSNADFTYNGVLHCCLQVNGSYLEVVIAAL